MKALDPYLLNSYDNKDCGKLLSLGHCLRTTNLKVNQDLPFDNVECRRVQMETLKKAICNNNLFPQLSAKPSLTNCT